MSWPRSRRAGVRALNRHPTFFRGPIFCQPGYLRQGNPPGTGDRQQNYTLSHEHTLSVDPRPAAETPALHNSGPVPGLST